MNATQKAITQRIAVVLLAGGLSCFSAVKGLDLTTGEQTIPVLKTTTTTYTNVTIAARNKTHLCIVHEGGVGNVFYEDLDAGAYALVGYVPPVPTGEKLKNMANEQASKVMKVLPWEGMASDGADAGPGGISEVPPAFIAAAVAVGLLLHLFFSYCAMLICRKTGTEPGIMVWLPIVQMIPMLRAAGMSGWWILAMPLPVVGLVLGIVWCFKLTSARGKSAFWGVLMLLPLTNLFSFLYLAFSDGDAEDSAGAPPRLAGLSVRTV